MIIVNYLKKQISRSEKGKKNFDFFERLQSEIIMISPTFTANSIAAGNKDSNQVCMSASRSIAHIHTIGLSL